MNHAPSSSTLAAGPWVIAGLIVIAALTRLLPHPPNFSPVEAIALFGGAYFACRRCAVIVPLVALLLSDLALAAINGGQYATWFSGMGIWLVYLCIAISAVMGYGMRGKVTGARVLGYSLAGSVLFFLVTNFGVWLGPMYPKTLDSLLAVYVAGIPFFKWTVLGTLFYAAILFGGFALLRAKMPALRAQTV